MAEKSPEKTHKEKWQEYAVRVMSTGSENAFNLPAFFSESEFAPVKPRRARSLPTSEPPAEFGMLEEKQAAVEKDELEKPEGEKEEVEAEGEDEIVKEKPRQVFQDIDEGAEEVEGAVGPDPEPFLSLLKEEGADPKPFAVSLPREAGVGRSKRPSVEIYTVHEEPNEGRASKAPEEEDEGWLPNQGGPLHQSYARQTYLAALPLDHLKALRDFGAIDQALFEEVLAMQQPQYVEEEDEELLW